jgi:hypothetical protein
VKRLLALGSWLLVVPTANSQQPTANSQQQQPTAPKVFLITLGQGAAYWEKYGHNMLWFYEPTSGLDVAYNWGSFDFTKPGFLRRLLLGDSEYWVDTLPGQAVIAYYQRHDRTITVQELNFTPEQASRALEFARNNMRPENRYYRYDYFLDNCSTRVRDVIDYALGGAIKRATRDTVDRTYRLETLRLLDDMKLTQLGVDFALAQPADRRITVWEGMFIPMRLRDDLRAQRVPGAGGSPVALISREQVVYRSQRFHERETPPVLWVPYLIVGILLALEMFAVGQWGMRAAGRGPENVFRVEVALWAFATGILGAILLGAWLGTRHVFWYRNENLLLVNPLSLFLALLAPLSIWKPRNLKPAAIIASLVALLSALALMLKGLPWFDQHNLELIALLLPVHFAVAYQMCRRANATA